MADDPELAFEQEVRNLLDRATKETGYSFSKILEIIDKGDAVQTAKNLVKPNNSGKIHEGLKFLVMHNKSDLSIEQAVINFKDSGLFTAGEISSAQARIAMAKMLFVKK